MRAHLGPDPFCVTMLETLHIENIAVIRQVDLDIRAGLTVLTGETGAGKSVLIDSIQLLLGEKADRTLIRTDSDTASVTGVFTQLPKQVSELLSEQGIAPEEDGMMMIRRTVNRAGKSMIRINGQPVTRTLLLQLSPFLIDIHGQNDTQHLLNPQHFAAVLDRYASLEDEVSRYRAVYDNLVSLRREMQDISKSEAERLRTLEMLRFQVADIDAVAPKPGEDRLIAEKLLLLKNSEKIQRQTQFAYRALKGGEKGNVLMLVSRSVAALESLASLLPVAGQLGEQLKECQYQLEDISEKIYDLTDTSEPDQVAAIDKLEGRLDAIERLCRKYGSGIEEVLAFRRQAGERLEKLERADERIAELQALIEKQTAEASARAQDLTEKRAQAALSLSGAISDNLMYLDMPNVRFTVSVQPKPLSDPARLGPRGADTVEALFSANKGEALQPVDRIASGGELSRLMLALRCADLQRTGAATVIFDEIDTGVSGKTARKIGLKMLQLADHMQVLCVTHSAQIASLADHHYRISKSETDGRTETALTLLDHEGAVEELSRILGGIHVTEAQRMAAADMIAEKEDLRSNSGS